MSKSDSRPRWRGLTEEDKKLWDAVSRSVRPFGARPRVPHPLETDLPRGVASKPAKRDVEDETLVAGSERRCAPMEEALGRTRQKPLAPFDQRRARRIATGRLAIDARLDLHGLYQSTARAQLHAFIRACYERDCRTVLVITGKGSTAEADRPFELDRPDRGVLRRNVPLWLSEPDMREMVVSFASAHSRHGGEGALYVQLRRRNRHRV